MSLESIENTSDLKIQAKPEDNRLLIIKGNVIDPDYMAFLTTNLLYQRTQRKSGRKVINV